jgi:hypothetical protein
MSKLMKSPGAPFKGYTMRRTSYPLTFNITAAFWTPKLRLNVFFMLLFVYLKYLDIVLSDSQPIYSKFDSDQHCKSGVAHRRRGVPDAWTCPTIGKLLEV